MKVLHTLLVGITGRGKWVLDLAKPDTGFQLAGICDIATEALKETGEALDLKPVARFTDLEAALDMPGLDCVILCTPTRTHVPFSLKALDRGLPVLVEKGMAPDWDSARQLVQVCTEKAGVLCVAQNYRYLSTEMRIGQCLRGEVPEAHPGDIHHVDLLQHRVRPEPRTLDYPFASIWDMSCHHFDSLIAWLGTPLAITAQAYGAPWSAYSHPNNTSAHIEFQAGTRVHYFHGHDSARNTFELAFHGTKGALTCNGKQLLFSERPNTQLGSCPDQNVQIPDCGPSESGVLRDFHRYITEGVEPGISARHNLEVMALCQMAVRSIALGRRFERREL